MNEKALIIELITTVFFMVAACIFFYMEAYETAVLFLILNEIYQLRIQIQARGKP